MEWEKIEDKWALMVCRVRADWTLPRDREQGKDASLTGRGGGGGSGHECDATDRPAVVPEHTKPDAG